MTRQRACGASSARWRHLKQRDRTGVGCVVDASLFESAVAWVQGPLNAYNVTKTLPQRHGAASATLAPYQIFETADRPICIAAGNDRLFVKLARAMGHPEWCQDPLLSDGRKRAANRQAVVDAMQPVLLTRTRQDWMGIIGEAGVPCAPVNDIAELAETEQLQAMDMMRTLPGSELKIVGLPITFDRVRPHPQGDLPKLGEHNQRNLRDRLTGGPPLRIADPPCMKRICSDRFVQSLFELDFHSQTARTGIGLSRA